MSPDAYTEMAQMQTTHWWFVARQKILRNEISRLNLPSGSSILEIGSGTGANLDLLVDFGHVLALEVSAEAITLAKGRRGATQGVVTMQQGSCPEDLNGLSQRFDLICLFDVLEHIEQDIVSLSKLAALLKPDGRLMLTVPAYQWMWGPHDVHLHHKRRYSKQRLSDDCMNAGLSIARISYFNTLLFPLALVGRIFDKLAGKKSPSATQTPPALINALFTFIFAFERHFLARMRLPFGLSLLLVAKPAP